MVDTKLFSLEVKLIASVWSHKHVHSGKTMKTVQQDLAR